MTLKITLFNFEVIKILIIKKSLRELLHLNFFMQKRVSANRFLLFHFITLITIELQKYAFCPNWSRYNL